MRNETSSRSVLLEGVSVQYRVASEPVESFKDYAIRRLTGRLGFRDVWALRDVSLSVRAGESVGIIGGNGAGKTSLLRVIAGILRPTTGTVGVHGSVAPVLELGTGFDYELTGLENVRLAGLLLGHRRADIEHRLPRIVEFSGLADMIRIPIRCYSSGMMARLGFALATAWVPDILLLDEVLSVGDLRFAAQCNQRLEELRAAGTTMLLISHDPNAIRANCDRCVRLKDGQLVADGPLGKVLPDYLDDVARGPDPVEPAANDPLELRTSP